MHIEKSVLQVYKPCHIDSHLFILHASLHREVMWVKRQPVTVSLPPELLRKVDSLVSAGNYANRSDLVREALRIYIRDHATPQKGGERG